MAPDLGLMFTHAIEVARDGAGADIRPLANNGISQVRQVSRLGAGPQGGLLQFHEVTDMDVFREVVAHPEARVWPGMDAALQFGCPNNGERSDFYFVGKLRVFDDRTGSYAAIL